MVRRLTPAGGGAELAAATALRSAHTPRPLGAHSAIYGGLSRPPPRSPMPPSLPISMQVRPSVLKTVPQPEDLRVGEDSTFVRRVIAAGYRAVHTEEELSAYSHGSSVSDMPGDTQRATSVRRAARRAPQAKATTTKQRRSSGWRLGPDSGPARDTTPARSARLKSGPQGQRLVSTLPRLYPLPLALLKNAWVPAYLVYKLYTPVAHVRGGSPAYEGPMKDSPPR
eukprot:scaffold75755_cov61-Phaeocystis_antarctica.AAC.2